jgi:Heterokaryon incompatibility protein (HET)
MRSLLRKLRLEPAAPNHAKSKGTRKLLAWNLWNHLVSEELAEKASAASAPVDFDPAKIPSHLKKLPLGDWRVPLCRERDEIRLVWLMPGGWDDPIICELRVVSLDKVPSYSAVSYVWGDSTQSESISVNGEDFHVTANLNTVLQYLRHERYIRVLWIDALCIHQGNNEEKAWQVDLMGRIYRNNTNAVFWIGREHEPQDPPPPGIQVLNESVYVELALQCLQDLADGIHLEDIWGSDRTEQQILEFKAMVNHGWDIVRRRSWWLRVWTLQESVLPNDAILKCGSVEISWSVIQKLESTTKAHAKCCRSKILVFSPNALPGLRNQVRAVRLLRQSKRQDFVQLYIQSAHRNATNPLDKIYGLTGMLEGDMPFNTNYDVDGTELCISLTKYLLQRNTTKNLFVMKRHTDLSEHMPSWVIDFITLWGTSSRRIAYRLHEKQDASPVVISELVIRDHILASPAFIIGHITRASSRPLNSRTHIDKSLASWRKLVEPNTYGPYEDSVAAFWNTMFGTSNIFSKVAKSAWVADSEVVYPNSEREISTEDIKVLDQGTHTAIKYFVDKRNFFITDQGYYGLGPMNLQIDDKIVIFNGIPTPLVVRKTETLEGDRHIVGNKPCYELIGDCYIHGLMAGEVVSLDYATTDTIYIR